MVFLLSQHKDSGRGLVHDAQSDEEFNTSTENRSRFSASKFPRTRHPVLSVPDAIPAGSGLEIGGFDPYH
jgi:hypothetical protein